MPDHINCYTKSVSEFELNVLVVIDGPLEPLPLRLVEHLKQVDLNSRKLREIMSTKKCCFFRHRTFESGLTRSIGTW